MLLATPDPAARRAATAAGRLVWRALPVRTRRALAFRRSFGTFPRRRDPLTFNEKVDHRLLHDRRPALVAAVDKLAAKDAAAAAGVRPARTLWSGTDLRELVGLDLGEHWVLKPNHRGGGLVHLGRGVVDAAGAGRLAEVSRGWLDPGSDEVRMGEWAYSRARRTLLVEERLGIPGEDLPDWKVHVFGGEPVLVQVHHGRFGDHRVRYYRPRWTPTAITARAAPMADVVPPPAHLDEMLAAARRLGAGWDYVRVDLYDLPDGVAFGELTVYPGSGLTDFRDDPVVDAELGRRWVLPGTAPAA